MHTIQLNEDEIISLNKVFDSAKNARAIRASTLRTIKGLLIASPASDAGS